jgi:hypothetical protein
MYYSTDPVEDAGRYMDAQGAFTDRLCEAEATVEAEIEAAFQANSDSLLPMTKALKPFMTSKWHEALAMLDYDMPEAELLNVLSLSTCPHVVALRAEIAKQYARCFADEIARERIEGDE